MVLTELKEEIYEPVGSPPSISSRLFAMYHARVADNNKHLIMKSMMHESFRKLSYPVLHNSLWYGCNVRTVVHFGPSSDIDDYFQESGRAGRDGIESEAVLFVYPGCLLGHVSKAMKNYCTSQQCRRQNILANFLGSTDT